MTDWLLLPEVEHRIERAIAEQFEPSAEVVDRIVTGSQELGKMKVVGKTAVIPIEGVLTQKRDVWAGWFGGGNTLYPDITASVEQANADPRVQSIQLQVGSSPGGEVRGLFQCLDSLKASKKPITAVVDTMAASGAYGLVSQASKIMATHDSTEFGSVGVAYDTWVSANEVSISSTEAPKKRPDLKTDEGKAVIRERLDEIHDMFVSAIAAGRNTTTSDVNKHYGRGAVVMARTALKAGMIDSIGAADQQKTQSAEGGKQGGTRTMDLEQLKIEFPAVYAAAVAEGTQSERDRVCAHLKMGQSSGAMETAIEAIKSGSRMTDTLNAEYMSAFMDRHAMSAREADNPEVGDQPAPKTSVETLVDAVAAELGLGEEGAE